MPSTLKKLRGHNIHFSLYMYGHTSCNLSHTPCQQEPQTIYILRRKSLVSTDTVCNNFARQS